MPWKILKPMDQKIQLIADWQKQLNSMTDIAKKYGISRKTVYKWCSRYEKHGPKGLIEQSRAPKYNPNKTSDDIIELLINEKLKNPKRGPKKIYYQLKMQYPNIKLPVPSTISYWLKKRDLVGGRKKRKNVPPYTQPFIEAQSPNAVWSADYKGQFQLKDKQICYPLTISDNYSRYLLSCQGLPGPRYQETRSVFEKTFREYGLPSAIRIDNGTPFAGRCAGGLSRLSIWWIQLGVLPERIDKGCPEQNGRHERMHRTLKLEAIDTMALNIKEQQRRFDLFLHDYNNYRPHESLDQKPPAAYYKTSSRAYTKKPKAIEYDTSCLVRNVRKGYFRFNSKFYYLSQFLHKQRIALKQLNEDQWRIYYSFYPLGILDARRKKVLKITSID